MPYGSICCRYHQLNYSSPNRSTTTKQEPHKRAHILENGRYRFRGKISGEWAKNIKGLDRKNDRKNKRGDIENWDQTDSPGILDRGETS